MKLGMLITGIILVIVGLIVGVVFVWMYATVPYLDLAYINWAGIITVGIVALATFIAGFILSLVGVHKT